MGITRRWRKLWRFAHSQFSEVLSSCLFLVVTDFKIKARSFKNKVFGGYVYFPQSALHSLSQAIAKFVNENGHPDVALQAFILNPGSPFFPVARGIGLFLYDGLGEKHARSAQGFEWLFTIEGANDMTKEQTLSELHRMTGFYRVLF